MLKDLTYQETSDELNKRGYYQEQEIYVLAPPAPEPVPFPAPEPEFLPSTPPSTTQPIIEPVPSVPFLEKYGKLVVLGVIGVFLLAIFPGGEG